jgi:hypothetical protein
MYLVKKRSYCIWVGIKFNDWYLYERKDGNKLIYLGERSPCDNRQRMEQFSYKARKAKEC